MPGFYQRLLFVDLENRSFAIEPLDEEVLRLFPGGKGLATWLLYRHNPPGVAPLAPENHLIFATGPATGSRVWGSCRYGVFSKSPQTGIYSESYSGGRVPEAIDACGFDAIVIRGAAAVPMVLRLHPDGADFLPAAELWGLDTYTTEDRLHELCAGGHRDGRQGAVVIGPAGENLVHFAVIENDYWRSAGRTGLGAVMGAKKLKGIFFAGDRRRPLADPEGAASWSRQLARESRDQAGVLAYKKLGTPMMVKIMNQAGAFPSRYWSRGSDDRWQRISAAALHERCEVRPHACRRCFMACGRLTTVREGRHRGLQIEGPEYETIYAFGGLCGVDSIEEIAWLNDICDRLGMDTISAGNLCAFAIEAGRRGRADCRLDYGDAEGIAALLRAIAAREGIGDLLAAGIRAAAREWGLEEMAVQVKGLEPAGYDPRVLKGMGLAYATSDRGACHLRTTFYKAELSGMIPPEQVEGKAELLLDFEDRLTIFDTLILCRFYRDLYPWEKLAEIARLTWGFTGGREELRRTAARISDLVRRFNLREGMRPERDDRLPPRLFQPLEDSGRRLEAAEMETMLRQYYRLRGWDETGRPPAAANGDLPTVHGDSR